MLGYPYEILMKLQILILGSSFDQCETEVFVAHLMDIFD